MAFRLTHIHDYNRFIAIDLGFYRVRAGIYDLSSGDLQCVGFSSVRQSRKNFSENGISDIRGVTQTIEQAIIQAGQNLKNIPNDIIINFPSSAFVSDVLSTQYVRADKDSTLTMQEVDSMIQLIEKESSERARAKQKRQFGDIHDDLRLVSSTIVSVTIDGKKVSNPIGFTGGRIRLTVLNVFVPSSEFNIIRSLVSNLGKRTISIIPAPLILPKFVEETELANANACYIDVGYLHTTVTVTRNNEIIGLESFSYGTKSLMQSLREQDTHLSLLQIENIICSETTIKKPQYRESIDDFLSYLQDIVLGYLTTEHIDIRIDELFLYGNIFNNTFIFREFGTKFSDALGYDIHGHRLSDISEKDIQSDQVMVEWLAIMARELLVVKKDPLVRILRYVLYQYE